MKGFITLWLAWFSVYGVSSFGGPGLPFVQMFSQTVDHVESFWVKMVFLNIPLQLVLSLLALLLWETKGPSARKIALGIAFLNTALILGHVILSLLYVP